MLPQTFFAFATMLMAVSAAPNYKHTTSKHTTSTTSHHSTTPTPTKTTTTTTTAASATPTINNGQTFVNQCVNTGVSVADCTQLLNIAALNGNSVNVGGTSTATPTAGSVNNGQQFLNECKHTPDSQTPDKGWVENTANLCLGANVGVSILDCAQLMNLALLNGNTIDISLADITALLADLGLSGLLGGLLPTAAAGTGLIALPTGIL